MLPRGGASRLIEAVPASMGIPAEDLNEIVIRVVSENGRNAENGGAASRPIRISCACAVLARSATTAYSRANEKRLNDRERWRERGGNCAAYRVPPDNLPQGQRTKERQSKREKV